MISYSIDALVILIYNGIFVQNIFWRFNLRKLFNKVKYSYFLTKCILLHFSFIYSIRKKWKNGHGGTFKRKRQYHSKRKKISANITVKHNRLLLHISKVVRKLWNILSIKKSLWIVQNEPVTALKGNKNLKELINSKKIESSKVKKHTSISSQCLVYKGTSCCE